MTWSFVLLKLNTSAQPDLRDYSRAEMTNLITSDCLTPFWPSDVFQMMWGTSVGRQHHDRSPGHSGILCGAPQVLQRGLVSKRVSHFCPDLIHISFIFHSSYAMLMIRNSQKKEVIDFLLLVCFHLCVAVTSHPPWLKLNTGSTLPPHQCFKNVGLPHEWPWESAHHLLIHRAGSLYKQQHDCISFREPNDSVNLWWLFASLLKWKTLHL